MKSKKINGCNPIKPSSTTNHRGKIDRKRVIQLANLGVIPSDIARNQGCAVSTITRYLQSVSSQVADIKKYSGTKADALCLSQLKLSTISNAILDFWLSRPDLVLSQDFRLQKEILVAVHGAKTYDHTAERLERGESTAHVHQIVDVISRIQQQLQGDGRNSTPPHLGSD